MSNYNFKSRIFDDIIKEAMRDYHQKEVEEYNNITEADKHKFSPEFEAEMNVLLKKGKRFKDDIRKSAVKFTKKAVIIILIILAISFVSLLSVKAIRENIFNFITNFYEKYIDVTAVDTDVPPETITEVRLPTYIPDGYMEADNSISSTEVYAYYIDDENEIITYYQYVISRGLSVDGEDYTESDVDISGMKGKFYEYNKSDLPAHNIIIWNDNRYVYELYSYLSRDEAVKMAESVLKTS